MNSTSTLIDKNTLELVANTIRGLSIDMVNAANSGHPGLPLGCAEIFTVLYGGFLRIDPNNPRAANRDRFILSAGHGSAGLYAALHCAGFQVTIDDLKQFRQLHSITPGHPEFNETPGVETTTGPLGQGIATAVGMAIASHHKRARFGHPEDHKVVVLAGDGCMMEGISSEASSLAGHLKLNNLIIIYDANNICLDGPIDETFTESVAQRYDAYGWNVVTIDGHSFDDISRSLDATRTAARPTLIIAKTIIGKGSPKYAGTHEAHGKPLGSAEAIDTKKGLGINPELLFNVPDNVRDFFSSLSRPKLSASESDAVPPCSTDLELALRQLSIKPGLATRAISQAILQEIHTLLPAFIGGSADLSCSDSTFLKEGGIMSPDNFSGRNIKFGVREFAMAAACSGLAIEGLRPFCGTFLTFSDYMKNAIRLAALMNLPVTYQLTHDSILLGEDGPTHQPIEHLAALRSMPNLTVIRPADINETKAAWIHSLTHTNPTALILSRQGISDSLATSIDGALKGAYIVLKETRDCVDVLIIATGSEVALGVDTAKRLIDRGHSVRVVSMPSFELFDAQPKSYQNDILCRSKVSASIEAQSSFGWHKYVGRDGLTISIDEFGKSAPAAQLATQFGFTSEAIANRIIEIL